MLRIGVLGAGFMGGTHARALAALPDVQVVAVSSRSAEKAAALAQEVGALPVTDARALIEDPAIDAVSITLPTYLHRTFAVDALAAGKHVLLEKPMGLTLAECDAIIDAARASGRVLMMEHTLRFWPEYATLVETVKSGRLGRPLSAVAQRLLTMPQWADWFHDASKSGGEVLDLHIHDLDMLNLLFGIPRSIYSRGQRGQSGGYDQAMSLIDYGDVQCFAEGSALMPEGYPFSCSIAVRCERGSIEYTVRAGGEQVDSAAAGINDLLLYEAGKPAQKLSGGPGDPYGNAIAHFVESILAGSAPTHGTPEQGRLAVQTALAARQSIESGEVVRF
jgi:predicted dehydrogenase